MNLIGIHLIYNLISLFDFCKDSNLFWYNLKCVEINLKFNFTLYALEDDYSIVKTIYKDMNHERFISCTSEVLWINLLNSNLQILMNVK